jgi:hypothetical protein
VADVDKQNVPGVFLVDLVVSADELLDGVEVVRLLYGRVVATFKLQPPLPPISPAYGLPPGFPCPQSKIQRTVVPLPGTSLPWPHTPPLSAKIEP